MTEFANVGKCDNCNANTKTILFKPPIRFELKNIDNLCRDCYAEIKRLMHTNYLDKNKYANQITLIDSSVLPITTGLKGDEPKMLRFNKGKPRYSLLYFPFLEEMIKVMEFGLKKGYPEGNWKLPQKDKDDICNSKMRHCVADLEGEFLDDESGISHVAHEAINAMFQYYHQTVGKENENR